MAPYLLRLSFANESVSELPRPTHQEKGNGRRKPRQNWGEFFCPRFNAPTGTKKLASVLLKYKIPFAFNAPRFLWTILGWGLTGSKKTRCTVMFHAPWRSQISIFSQFHSYPNFSTNSAGMLGCDLQAMYSNVMYLVFLDPSVFTLKLFKGTVAQEKPSSMVPRLSTENHPWLMN